VAQLNFQSMSRNAAFWAMVIGLMIPVAILGFLRGRAIKRAYLNIYVDLKKAGIERSQADLQALIVQLQRNPGAILSADSQDVSRGIKEKHVLALLSYLKPIRYGVAVIIITGVVAVLLFPHLWPK
jgi:hypothetical protein